MNSDTPERLSEIEEKKQSLNHRIRKQRKSLRAAKKRAAKLDAEKAAGKRKRGCSGCLKNGIELMKKKLNDLRLQRKRIDRGIITAEQIEEEERKARIKEKHRLREQLIKKEEKRKRRAEKMRRKVSSPPEDRVRVIGKRSP